MFLSEVFPPELIKIGLDSVDKDEAFEEMVDKYCQTRKSGDREKILGAIWARESKMSTGIKKGIAIPHGKTSAVDNICGILGISKKGIEYDSLDGQPVYILFMLLVPETDSENHLRIIKRLAELLNNHACYTDLLAQKDPHSASGIIKKHEDIYIASE
jgi:PTS system fructose-specific IIC component/PTS system nitrogen regulatory IIA component